MILGEVCLLTDQVIAVSNFYKFLLAVDNGSNDPVHQAILSEETMLTVFHDGLPKGTGRQNMSLSFTVKDIQKEYHRLSEAGVEIVEKPTARPWGLINMVIRDPDGNLVYLRQVP